MDDCNTFVGLSDREVRHIKELISTIESDYEDEDSDVDSSIDENDLPENDEPTHTNTPESEHELARENQLESGNTSEMPDSDEESEEEPPAKRQRTTNVGDPSVFHWKSGNFNPIIHNFDSSNSGITLDLNENVSILELFELFFTQEFARKVSAETNKYYVFATEKLGLSRNSRLTKWTDTNYEEIYLYIAVTLLISRNSKLRVSDCWSNDPLLNTPIFHKVMSRDRYLLLSRMLHFCDNRKQNKNDRLFKIRMVTEHFTSISQQLLVPFENLCIDESLVLFKGRLAFKQYIKSKRHRFGIKLFILMDTEADYILDTIIYTGSTTEYQKTDPKLGISGAIVMSLMKPYLEKGHKLYTDNWYTSPFLAEALHISKTNLCGTVRSHRKQMPKIEKKLKKGDTASLSTDKILVTKWMDRREVTMLTTFHEDKLVATGKTDYMTGESKKKPECVKYYNVNMGAIDKVDMLLSSVECLRKSMKWYKKIFFHYIDLMIVNAYSLYKIKTGENISLAEFQLTLIRELLEKYCRDAYKPSKKGRPSKGDNPLRLTGRHFLDVIPSVPGGKKASQRICHVCKHTEMRPKKRRDSRYYCQDCNVGLCITPCFQQYHTLKKF